MKKLILTQIFIFSLSSFAVSNHGFDPKGDACSFDKFMKNLVLSEHDAPEINTFLVAENIEHPDLEYWVYWPQQRTILLVGWPAKDCKSPFTLIRRRLDLTKDVMRSQGEVGSSTYLVTKDWAQNVIYDAAKNGHQVSVKK